MILKKLNEVTSADLNLLLLDQRPEGRTIEYKQELPGANDGEKVKFLRAVSSLANTDGGDVLFGVEARDGLPVSLPGIEATNEDEVRLRIENMLRTGLEPRLTGVHLHFVPVDGGRAVLIVRADRSWRGPHRVVVGGHAHFYARNSAGSYQMDVEQLRAAFALGESISRRVADFIGERHLRIERRQFAVPMKSHGTMIFHLVPLSGYAGPVPARIDFARQDRDRFGLPTHNGWCHEVNLDGYVLFDVRGNLNVNYLQIFRTGAIELAVVFGPWEGGIKGLPTGWIERQLVQSLSRAISVLGDNDIRSPFALSLAFFHIGGYNLHVDRLSPGFRTRQVDSDTLILPLVLVEDEIMNPAAALRPIFDMMWNAFGMECCGDYDENGNLVV